MSEHVSASSSWRHSLGGLLKAAAITGGVCVVGYIGYKKLYVGWSKAAKGSGIPETPAEARKRIGVELYRQKNYQGAIDEFKAAIALVAPPTAETGTSPDTDNVRREFLATIHNNIAACYDGMGELNECIEHCSEAIALSPYPYWKPINRRARSYHRQKKFKQALHDYIGALSPPPSEEQKKAVEVEIERVLTNLVTEESAVLFPQLQATFKPIPQHIVFDWVYSTVVNDPLLKRMQRLEPTSDGDLEGLDRVLWKVKKSRFDEVLPEAKRIYEDEQSSPVGERIQALLLAARFLYFHNLRGAAVEMLDDGFEKLWTRLSDEDRGAYGELKTALHTLRVTLAESTQEAERLVDEQPNNVDALVVLGVMHLQDDSPDNAQRVFKKVLSLCPDHPYAKYYDHYTTFQLALRSQVISEVHNAICRFDQAVQAATESGGQPPVIAMILLAKICLATESTDMALAMSKQILGLVPNCAFAMYTYGILITAPSTATTQLTIEGKKQLVGSVEKVMDKVLEMDSNYWEPYRMLSMIFRERRQIDKALEHMNKAISLIRKKEELDFLLNDKHYIVALKERLDAGMPIPEE